MANATQMNFRIDANLKAAGDLTLGESGVTPSLLVRSTWEYLVRNRHVPNAVTNLMGFLRTDGATPLEASPTNEAASEAEEVVMKGPNLIARFYEELGVQPQRPATRSFEDLKLDAYAEKYPGLNAAE